MSSQKTILVADDESHILNVVSLKLRNAGFAVLTAANGQEAFDLASTEHPDLLITDYSMPILNGIELCRQLKRNAGTASIPAIMLTARGHSMEENEAAQSGILRLLSKPFSPRELLETVNAVLQVAA